MNDPVSKRDRNFFSWFSPLVKLFCKVWSLAVLLLIFNDSMSFVVMIMKRVSLEYILFNFFVVITGITAFNAARFCHTFSILIVDHGEIMVLDMASILN